MRSSIVVGFVAVAGLWLAAMSSDSLSQSFSTIFSENRFTLFGIVL
jgi:hypothetical protein